MIEAYSNHITDYMIDKDIIKEEEQAIYNYCVEIAIVSIISYFFLILFAIVFNEINCSFLFLIIFSLFRRVSGGYHASSYVKCSVISLISFLAFILMIKKAYFFEYNYFFLIIGLGIIIAFAPIEDKNKPIHEKQYKLLKKISRILAITFIFIFSIIKIFFHQAFIENKLVFSISYGINLVAFSLLISKYERRKDCEAKKSYDEFT